MVARFLIEGGLPYGITSYTAHSLCSSLSMNLHFPVHGKGKKICYSEISWEGE